MSRLVKFSVSDCLVWGRESCKSPRLGGSMTSHFSTIGLPVASEEDMNALANRVGPLAEPLAAPNGVYFRWSDPSGAELWLQVNANNEVIGMNPHYAGRSAVRVGLTARLPSAGPSELDGSFHGWADPAGDAPDTGATRSFSMPQTTDCTRSCRCRREARFRLRRLLTRSPRS